MLCVIKKTTEVVYASTDFSESEMVQGANYKLGDKAHKNNKTFTGQVFIAFCSIIYGSPAENYVSQLHKLDCYG